MSIEAQMAAQLAHQDHVIKLLARTGGEIIHPDHYDIREAIRLSVLAAIDAATDEQGAPRMSDGELPNLFRTIDAIASRVFLKGAGL